MCNVKPKQKSLHLKNKHIPLLVYFLFTSLLLATVLKDITMSLPVQSSTHPLTFLPHRHRVKHKLSKGREAPAKEETLKAFFLTGHLSSISKTKMSLP